MTPLTYLPDADPTTPGVMRTVFNLIPSARGYQDAPGPDVLVNAATASTPYNGAMLQKLDGSSRIFVGHATGVDEFDGSAWVNRLSASAQGPGWVFKQFGNATLVGSSATGLHQSTSTSFSSISGSPTCNAFCITSTFQVMAVGLSTQADGWACSALADYTNWTPDLGTQAATARFLATPGPARACIPFGPHVLAFKERSMYWMRYLNVPVIWGTELISNEVGCVGAHAVCDVGERIFFVGPEDFYLFDGTRPVPIGEGVRETFFQGLAWDLRSLISCVYDARSDHVWVFYPSLEDGSSSFRALVYHVGTGRWGHATYPVQCAFPLIAFPSVNSMASGLAPGFGRYPFGSATIGAMVGNQLTCLRKREGTSSFRLGWFGDDGNETQLTKLRPRFLQTPAEASAQFYASDDLDSMAIARDFTAMKEKAFGTSQRATWHSAEIQMRAPFEIAGYVSDLPKSGGKR